MKHILFFGDSNTWGFIPASYFQRYPFEKRICGILQKNLGNEYRIIEETLNGRMTVWEDPFNSDKNASKQLGFILDSHRPIDLVVIMLGVNDMKYYMKLTALDSAMGCGKLIEIVKGASCGPNGEIPKVLLIAPPAYVNSTKPFGKIFEGAIEKTKLFGETYQEIAHTQGVHFFDASTVAEPPYDGDGVHIDEHGTRAIAEAVFPIIRELV